MLVSKINRWNWALIYISIVSLWLISFMGFHRFVLPHGFPRCSSPLFAFFPSVLVRRWSPPADIQLKNPNKPLQEIFLFWKLQVIVYVYVSKKQKKHQMSEWKKKHPFTKSRSFKKLHLQVAPAFRPPRYGRSSPLTFTCYTEAARGSVEPRWPKKSCMDTAYVWEIPSPYNKVQEVPSILGIWNSWWCKGPMNIFGWAVDYFLHFRPSFSFLLLTSLFFRRPGKIWHLDQVRPALWRLPAEGVRLCDDPSNRVSLSKPNWISETTIWMEATTTHCHLSGYL